MVFSETELTTGDEPVEISNQPKNARKPEKVASKYPEFADMPAEFRREVPRLDVNVHVYSDAVDERFVLVKMEKYQEGDSLPGGVKLKLITPEGLVLSYRGKTFLYPP